LVKSTKGNTTIAHRSFLSIQPFGHSYEIQHTQHSRQSDNTQNQQ
jgi:hypothetical protein